VDAAFYRSVIGEKTLFGGVFGLARLFAEKFTFPSHQYDTMRLAAGEPTELQNGLRGEAFAFGGGKSGDIPCLML